jgi:hypothetical protein
MFFRQTLPFISDFISNLDLALREKHPDLALTRKQKAFLSLTLMGIVVTNSVCWARFERASLGAYTTAALSWMFRRAPIPWEKLLDIALSIIIGKLDLTQGVLVVDDTDHQRSKNTTKIAYTHKVFDKKTGGDFNGQTIVFTVLVTPQVTIPVGFAFYLPDPAVKAWEKENGKLKKNGVPKSERPPKPAKDLAYPTKIELAERLVQHFHQCHPEVKIKAVTGDNLYTTAPYMDGLRLLLGCQVLGSLKCNQLVCSRGKKLPLSEYFERNPPSEQKIKVRGEKEITILYRSARLFVPSHGKKRFVIGIRYSEEDEWTYLCATDLSWRTIDIIECWTLRWLVEVFIEDFKVEEGWGQLAKQQGVEGSFQGVTLSLLLDLCLLLHPQQEARLKRQEPALTVGSLLRQVRAEALMMLLESLLMGKTGKGKLKELYQLIADVFKLQPSKKHMSGRELGRLEPTESLKRFAHAS